MAYRKPTLAELHDEIERLIEYAAQVAGPGRDEWYRRQMSRWEANRPTQH